MNVYKKSGKRFFFFFCCESQSLLVDDLAVVRTQLIDGEVIMPIWSKYVYFILCYVLRSLNKTKQIMKNGVRPLFQKSKYVIFV